MSNLTEKYMAWVQYQIMYSQLKNLRGTYRPGALRWSGLFETSIQASRAIRGFGEKLQDHGKFHSQLATSFLEAESAIISFTNALATVKNKCSIEPVDIKKWESDLRESEMNGALIALQFKDYCDGSNIYGYSPAYKALSWLQVAEKLPSWKKEMAKRAFNVKYHG